MRTIGEAATELAELKSTASVQEAALKKTKEQIERLTKQEIPAILEANGLENAKVEGVGTVYLNTEVFAYVTKENEERLHDWLRENGHADLIKPTVHPGTFKAFAKEQLEQGQSLPDFVQASFVTKAALRKK